MPPYRFSRPDARGGRRVSEVAASGVSGSAHGVIAARTAARSRLASASAPSAARGCRWRRAASPPSAAAARPSPPAAAGGRRGCCRGRPGAPAPRRAAAAARSPRRISASSSARSRSSGAGSGAPSAAGSARTSTAPAPNASISSPSRASAVPLRPAGGRVGRRQVDHRRQQQRLAAHPAGRMLRPQRLVRQPLMRGVLVDQHQAAVGGDRDDVGVEHLRQRRPERVRPAPASARRSGTRGRRRRRAAAAPRRSPGSAGRRPAGVRATSAQRRPRRAPRAPLAPPASARRSAPITSAAHRGRVAEAQLGLGRMHVDVELLGRQRRGTARPPGAARRRSRRDRRPARAVRSTGSATGRPLTTRLCAAAGGAASPSAARRSRRAERRRARRPPAAAPAAVRPEQAADARRAVLRRQVEQRPGRRSRSRNATAGAASARRRTACSACSASVRGALRNLRRAGVAKNRSRDHDPRARRAGGGRHLADDAPPSTRDRMRHAPAPRGREVMRSRAAAPMLGSASPRKPSVVMRTSVVVGQLRGGVPLHRERQVVGGPCRRRRR